VIAKEEVHVRMACVKRALVQPPLGVLKHRIRLGRNRIVAIEGEVPIGEWIDE
jgi:hypothetical protein